MLDFVLDFIFDIILEGSVAVMSEKKVPMFIRIIAGIIVVFLYVGIGGLCIYAAILAYIDSEILPAALFLAIGLFVLIGGFYQIRKEIRKKRCEDNEVNIYDK